MPAPAPLPRRRVWPVLLLAVAGAAWLARPDLRAAPPTDLYELVMTDEQGRPLRGVPVGIVDPDRPWAAVQSLPALPTDWAGTVVLERTRTGSDAPTRFGVSRLDERTGAPVEWVTVRLTGDGLVAEILDCGTREEAATRRNCRRLPLDGAMLEANEIRSDRPGRRLRVVLPVPETALQPNR